MHGQHLGLQFLPFESSLRADRTCPFHARQEAASRIGHPIDRKEGAGAPPADRTAARLPACFALEPASSSKSAFRKDWASISHTPSLEFPA